jgi:glycosyltransferase involved in cell wall biosynthesis
MQERARPSARRLAIVLLDSLAPWGGGEAWCLDAARRLRARGHRVAVACARGGALEARARAAGVEVWSARLAGAAALAGALRFAHWARRERFDVAVATVGFDVRAAALAALLGGPRVVQRRGIARPLRRDPLTRWLYTRVVRRVIANTQAIRGALLGSAPWADPARFVVVPNGVALPDAPERGRDAARAALGLEPADVAVGVVARLAPMKGHGDLLDAWAELPARSARARLLVAGDGPERAALEARARALGIESSVRWLGFCADVARVYPALDLLALASVRDEGASHAVLESMAHGIPAVVTRCGGLPELVLDGETGLVVPARDPRALAAALSKLIADPELRRAMGRAARARAAAHFDPERATDRLVEVLASA